MLSSTAPAARMRLFPIQLKNGLSNRTFSKLSKTSACGKPTLLKVYSVVALQRRHDHEDRRHQGDEGRHQQDGVLERLIRLHRRGAPAGRSRDASAALT